MTILHSLTINKRYHWSCVTHCSKLLSSIHPNVEVLDSQTEQIRCYEHELERDIIQVPFTILHIYMLLYDYLNDEIISTKIVIVQELHSSTVHNFVHLAELSYNLRFFALSLAIKSRKTWNVGKNRQHLSLGWFSAASLWRIQMLQ